MAAAVRQHGAPLAGRDAELDRLAALLRAAHAGTASTVLLTGAPGVGKTALVAAACHGRDADTTILTALALPMRTVPVPFQALRDAFRSDPASAVFAELTGGDIPPAVDRRISDLCRERPVLLWVDDVQWADPSTLDTLIYLVAGPTDRPLAIVLTMRDTTPGDDGTPARWLADVRRLPGVAEWTVGPLDRPGTGDLIAGVIGSPPHQSLVDDVYRAAAGNCYLTRLLVDGLPADSRRLPAVTGDLRASVLQGWNMLDPAARTACRMLALVGRPAEPATLGLLAGHPVDRELDRAVGAGLLEPSGRTVWFHHPVIAEVLLGETSSAEARRWHRLMVDASPPLDELDGAGLATLATHLLGAGDSRAAAATAVLAADRAAAAGSPWEAARLLRSALDIDGEPTVGALDRLRELAAAAGALELELDAIDALLRLMDPESEPVGVAAYLVRRAHLRFSTGRSFFDLDDALHAEQLAAHDAGGAVHAWAVAELAHTALWWDRPDAVPLVDRALAAARAAGDDRALSYALTASAIRHVNAGRLATGCAEAREALQAALRIGDGWAAVHAVLWETNAGEGWMTREVAELTGRRRTELAAAGVAMPFLAWLAASEAGSWLSIGHWQVAGRRIREALGTDTGALVDLQVRLAAARLAALQGRTGEARAHLDRADELVAEGSSFLPMEFDAVHAEVAVLADDPGTGYDWAIRGMSHDGVVPTMCEWLAPLAARALADLIQRGRDTGATADGWTERLVALRARVPAVIAEAGPPTPSYRRVLDALQLLYDAETARAGGDPAAQLWQTTVAACAAAGLSWEAAYAGYRASAALLSGRRPDRRAGTRELQEATVRARELAAVALLERLEQLATSARIHSVPTRPTPVSSTPSPGLPGLTAREREILRYVVAGHSYAEIGRAMFISEKTVSSHLSHMLAKTGTTSRVELAQLALRTTGG